jgi:dolichol-phosphate mannosyltransferase
MIAPPGSGVVADIVIPVYNEGRNIRGVLDSLRVVSSPIRILICYDFEEDDTLASLAGYDPAPLSLVFVRNRGTGVMDAVRAGFEVSEAPCVITYPADDDYNGTRVDTLLRLGEQHDVVCASRFMSGGSMQGCRLLKAVLVRTAAFFMYYVVRVPTRDATNGLRLFSRRVLERLPIESTTGFAFSIELLVKAHRMGWPIAETPCLWRERRVGKSRFNILGWLPEYLKWVRYAMATTFLGRRAEDVRLRENARTLQRP